jgi:hypothetical protein
MKEKDTDTKNNSETKATNRQAENSVAKAYANMQNCRRAPMQAVPRTRYHHKEIAVRQKYETATDGRRSA